MHLTLRPHMPRAAKGRPSVSRSRGRRDSAGRIIPHEFVIIGDVAKEILSVETGQRQVWPLVQDAFARTWMLAAAPRAADLRLTD